MVDDYGNEIQSEAALCVGTPISHCFSHEDCDEPEWL
jgi:hypothetical protein